ncbi:hypothetical protein D6783_02575, partial [Candidatus Woesearchaeota archaeon]
MVNLEKLLRKTQADLDAKEAELKERADEIARLEDKVEDQAALNRQLEVLLKGSLQLAETIYNRLENYNEETLLEDMNNILLFLRTHTGAQSGWILVRSLPDGTIPYKEEIPNAKFERMLASTDQTDNAKAFMKPFLYEISRTSGATRAIFEGKAHTIETYDNAQDMHKLAEEGKLPHFPFEEEAREILRQYKIRRKNLLSTLKETTSKEKEEKIQEELTNLRTYFQGLLSSLQEARQKGEEQSAYEQQKRWHRDNNFLIGDTTGSFQEYWHRVYQGVNVGGEPIAQIVLRNFEGHDGKKPLPDLQRRIIQYASSQLSLVMLLFLQARKERELREKAANLAGRVARAEQTARLEKIYRHEIRQFIPVIAAKVLKLKKMAAVASGIDSGAVGSLESSFIDVYNAVSSFEPNTTLSQQALGNLETKLENLAKNISTIKTSLKAFDAAEYMRDLVDIESYVQKIDNVIDQAMSFSNIHQQTDDNKKPYN